MNRPWHKSIPVVAAMLMVLPALLFAVPDLSPALLRYIHSRWGDEGAEHVQDWQRYMHAQQFIPVSSTGTKQRERDVLLSDNAFWNRVPYFSDKQHWGVDDYWATPIEMQGSNGGDCEDYSIGKYFTLKYLGVPVQKLRIVYVRALSRNEPHMVLAYYPEPDAEPFILDNLNSEILPASKRTDLDPVFSFNDDDLWAAESQYKTGKSSQIRLWRELLEKMDKEQKL
ncbi:MAG: transglutaminase-like cysteine peptidase [Nitrosomonadales bacterium]|nr:transglutaminase-like cysteine peptidase [Nitrosomonadales bacterium]